MGVRRSPIKGSFNADASWITRFPQRLRAPICTSRALDNDGEGHWTKWGSELSGCWERYGSFVCMLLSHIMEKRGYNLPITCWILRTISPSTPSTQIYRAKTKNRKTDGDNDQRRAAATSNSCGARVALFPSGSKDCPSSATRR